MALSLEQIKSLVETRPKKNDLNRAIIHQDRLRFHTETQILKNELSPYLRTFEDWICAKQPELLPADKVARFKQLMTCPLPTVQLTESIALAWSRVFEGQDAFNRYDFQNPNNLADWQEYQDTEFWKTDGFQAMINAIDSVWVVDLPAEQKGEKPEPKNMLIDISNVIDLSVKRSGECNYVIFSINEKLFVYDDELIAVYQYKDKRVGSLINEFRHELGYCPARMFWSELLNKKNYINHKAPLTNVLSELDWKLVHSIFKKEMDMGNSYPITVSYPFADDSGDFTREQNKGRGADKQKTLGGALMGPGTFWTVPIPQEGQPDLMSNPIKHISPDIESLEFHVKEEERLNDYIFKTAVGVDGEQSNDQAKNEKQVLASFESQSIILQRIATNLEKIQAFAEMVLIAIRYGEDVTPSIDYGSKFFLKTAEDLSLEREAIKGDDVMFDSLSQDIIETRFRNDSGGKLRAKVIGDLDPLPGRTIEETIKLKDAGGIDEKGFMIKVNLMSFVRRFESEQIPLAPFVQGKYWDRIKKIREEFYKYIKESGEEKPVSNNQNKLNEDNDSGESESKSGN